MKKLYDSFMLRTPYTNSFEELSFLVYRCDHITIDTIMNITPIFLI